MSWRRWGLAGAMVMGALAGTLLGLDDVGRLPDSLKPLTGPRRLCGHWTSSLERALGLVPARPPGGSLVTPPTAPIDQAGGELLFIAFSAFFGWALGALAGLAVASLPDPQPGSAPPPRPG